MRVGCDLISIERVEIYNKHGKIFLSKFLSPEEQKTHQN